jgi:ribokinase
VQVQSITGIMMVMNPLNAPKIVAIGAASQDVFITGKALKARRDVKSRDFVEQFPLGAKVEVEDVVYDTGGGASNAAVTFARQGLSTTFLGKIGQDPAGTEVLRSLAREGVGVDGVAYDPRLGTQYSTILLAPGGERTILIYRGASHDLKASDFAIRSIEADWLYISSLSGNLDLLSKLLKHANTRGIKVALDPGAAELAQTKKLRRLLPLLTVLKANVSELGQLSMTTGADNIVRELSKYCPYVIVTDGSRGCVATDGTQLYRAGQYQKVRVLDRTGAGDAFGSGFVAALAKGFGMEAAMTLASANSTAVVQSIGAKPGILRTHRLKRMKIVTRPL